MKVLQLCNKPPQPMVDGGCIAMNTISTALLDKGIDLKILTVATDKHPFLTEKISAEFKEKTQIESVFLDTRVNIIDAFSALVTSDSYNISRFFSPDFDKKLIHILGQDEYDVIHLESLFMTPYLSTIRKYSEARIVLRSHNLEHLIWERLANSTGNKAKRIYLKHLASRLKQYEKRTINEVDGIAAISFEDTERFKELECKVPLVTIPFGIDLEKHQPKEKSTENVTLFHIGAMNWAPNEEAINWFLDEIWPGLSHLDLKLHLAGRLMPDYISKQSNERLIIDGEVESAADFMNSHDIMVVPLLSGSGMRIKIIEAMAHGKTIVSTTVGAEGIDYKDRENILIADSKEEFVTTISRLMKQRDEIQRIGKNARLLVEEKYSNTKIIQNLLEFYKTV